MRFEEVDGCAVPAVIADEVREVKRRTGATLVSCDRSNAAEPILRRNGKMTQEQLWEGWRDRRPGFNPANPPGRSTHERRNDGVAFWGRVGRLLRAWQVGQDWEAHEVPSLIRAYAQLGWRAVLTYPNNPRERHHINLVKKGKAFIPFLVVREGDGPKGRRGRRVGYIRWALGFVHDPDTHKPYLSERFRAKSMDKKGARTFGPHLREALIRFQRDWQQAPDGVYGPQTHVQLVSRVRARKRKEREERRKRR